MRRLLIRPGAIGDVVTALPAMEFLRAEYTEVWVPSPVVPLLRFADRVRSIQETGLDLLEIPGQSDRAREALAGFDSIVSWYGAGRNEFANAVAGLPIHLLPALPVGCHAADYFLAQARRVVGECEARGVSGHGSARPRLPVEWKPGGYCVIHPFSGSPRKNWPLALYRQAAERLQMPVFWTAGSEEELPEAVRFANLWELAQWIAQASLYIGNDSGITHLAAACGTPVIAIFQASDPAIWAPRGDDVRVLVTPDVEELIAEANRR